MTRSNLLCTLMIAATLSALALHPRTGWLVRQQLGVVFGGQGERLVRSLEEPPASRLSPEALAAHDLRAILDKADTLTLDRREEANALSLAPQPAPVSDGMGGYGGAATEAKPKSLPFREILAKAEAGARLDPGNGFFPTMRAAALLGLRRDSEAEKSLENAARKPFWRDYAVDEVRAKLAALDARGPHTAIADEMVWQGMLFSDVVILRNAAQVFTALAVRRELAGDRVGGSKLRRDLRALAGTILGSSNGLFLWRTAEQVTVTSCLRPGGAALLPRGYPKKERRSAQLAAFYRYAPEDAAEVRELLARAEKLSQPKDSGDESFGTMAMRWQLALDVLSAALFAVLFGGFCGLLLKTSRFREARPITPGAKLALWGLLSLAPLACVFAGYPFFVEGEIALALLALAQFWFSTRRGERLRGLLRVFPVLGGALIVAGLAALSHFGHVTATDLFMDRYMRCYAAGGGEESVPSAFVVWCQDAFSTLSYWSLFLWPSLVPFVALALPAAIYARVKRVPVTVGVTRAFVGFALPITLLLTLGYGWLAMQTAAKEAVYRAALRRE